MAEGGIDLKTRYTKNLIAEGAQHLTIADVQNGSLIL